MPRRLEDYNREYKRFRYTPEEKIQLAKQGLQHVLSSNVSAVGRDGEDLIIRFHNSSIYRYPGKGDMYQDMLNSNSKGSWVWQNLRYTNANYIKIGSFKLENDIDLSDEEMFNDIDNSVINKLTSNLKATVTSTTVTDVLKGVAMKKVIIGGLIIYTLI